LERGAIVNTGLWFRIAFGFLFFYSIICVEPLVFTSSEACPDVFARRDSFELLPLANPRKLTQLEQAYLDSFSILRSENSCSAFFGGSRSIVALNEFTQQIRPSHFDQRVGIRMSGPTTIVTSAVTHFTFRLFEKVEVNLNGPFYRASPFAGSAQLPTIGPFDPNTREARVTALLHELGHLIQKPDRQWVLPNDGNDAGISRENTSRVVAACGEQIRSLHKLSFEEELLGVQSSASLKPGEGASEARPRAAFSGKLAAIKSG
jgi:hypothetical protein